MLKQVNKFLTDNHLNLHQINQKTGISMSTLSNTFRRPVRTWKVSIIQALAKVLYTSPAHVLSALIGDAWHLVCNDKAHTIQGAKIPTNGYDNIKSSVITECYEGWQPSKHDIELLVYSYNHPSNDVLNQMKKAKAFVRETK